MQFLYKKYLEKQPLPYFYNLITKTHFLFFNFHSIEKNFVKRICFFYIINMGVQTSLRVSRLIPWTLKLMIM
jgi:hypothetical protein